MANSSATRGIEGGGPVAAEGYEVPRLTQIGNLHDLLAAENGSQCDESGQPTTGIGGMCE